MDLFFKLPLQRSTRLIDKETLADAARIVSANTQIMVELSVLFYKTKEEKIIDEIEDDLYKITSVIEVNFTRL
jgi:uncharacterized protein YjgD (DUF1641 family)